MGASGWVEGGEGKAEGEGGTRRGGKGGFKPERPKEKGDSKHLAVVMPDVCREPRAQPAGSEEVTKETSPDHFGGSADTPGLCLLWGLVTIYSCANIVLKFN